MAHPSTWRPQSTGWNECPGEGQAGEAERAAAAASTARAAAARADSAAIDAAREVGLEAYRLALTISTGLEEERVHREEGYRIEAEFTRLRYDLARAQQLPLEREVGREMARLMRLGRWDYTVAVPHRHVRDLGGYFTRVAVYAAPPEREAGR